MNKGFDHRGIWRAVYTSLWDDPEFRKFTPKEKLVFLNLRTCPHSNIPVIFLYYIETINRQTGVGMKSIRSALRTLSDRHWIEIEDGIVWIRKGLRFDPNIALTNDKHLIAIKNVILSLPKSQIVRDFLDYYKIDLPYSIPSRIPYRIAYGNQDTNTKEDTKKETEQEEESEEKLKINTPFSFKEESQIQKWRNREEAKRKVN